MKVSHSLVILSDDANGAKYSFKFHNVFSDPENKRRQGTSNLPWGRSH